MDLEEIRNEGGGWSYVLGIWTIDRLLRTGQWTYVTQTNC